VTAVPAVMFFVIVVSRESVRITVALAALNIWSGTYAAIGMSVFLQCDWCEL
jgi:hypothetical protein